jgi:small subunit ribosomal protein S5
MRPMRGGRFGTRGGRFGGKGGPGRGPRRDRGPQEKPEFDQKTLGIARVARVTKGGKRFSFRATVVAGNGKGKVGVGIAKGRDVQQSVGKAYHQAKKALVTVPIKDGTILYQVEGKYSSAVVLLKPSKSGIKAGGAVRVVAQMAGISSLTGKLTRRTNNKINIARATIQALQKLRADKTK